MTADHLGSARIITNEKGIVTGRKDYTAFGEEITTSQRTAPNRTDYTDLDEIRQGYTGYEKDTESGLEYAQARYYNSKHGRFTSVDPLTASASIRNPQTFNRYSYVLNSPYKFTDPLGLLPITVACGQTCPNSGDYVDGSAFSGTDSPFKKEFDDMKAQRQKPPPPPPCPVGVHMCFGEQAQQDNQTDETLGEIFTDTGTVEGLSYPPYYNHQTGELTDNHFRFADGTLHTIHIYGNPRGESAGVFIPEEFSSVIITSEDTVVATNLKTGEVILIAHVKVGKGREGRRKLSENMKNKRENGTVYIGEIGGKGGSGGTAYSHAHLSYFPSESARLKATNFKRKMGGLYDFQKRDVGGLVSSFTNFIKK